MKRLLFLLPLAAFLAVAAWFVFGLGRDPGVLPSALLDDPAPTFDLPPLEGRATAERFSTADLKGGNPVLVNVFASWCVPCRAEHPMITALANRHGLTVYGIAYKDDPEASKRFLDELGDPFKLVGVDRSGRTGIDWGVYGVPETFIVDGKGVVRYRYPGPLTPRVIDDEILPIIRSLKG